MDDDAINEYDQAPPPYEPLYVHVDDQYRDWYRAKHGIETWPGFVFPVTRDVPGHPQDGYLWDQLIVYFL